jgi:putative ABC transport system permease protein
MLVSVLARFQEIGIRMVEGATRGDIAVQFLVESSVLCLLGAILGIPASYVLARIWLSVELSQFAAYAVDVGNAVQTALIVLGAGLLAGIAPAVRASRLDPVEALRHV